MKENSSSIAILYICTGKYVVLWEEFYNSFEKLFIPEMEKHYYVFTDYSDIYASNSERVHVFFQENLGWPGNTLFRYKIFLTQKDVLLKHEFIYYMNADALCVEKIGEEFLPLNEDMVFVQHPGYYSSPTCIFPYERRKKSNAYIPYFRGKAYICGGINGGRSDAYIRMCELLDARINEDYDNGIIARWHDESHVNKFFYENENYKLLPPAYCYPEFESIPFSRKIVVRNKNRYFNVDQVKKEKCKTPIVEWIFKQMYRLKSECD